MRMRNFLEKTLTFFAGGGVALIALVAAAQLTLFIAGQEHGAPVFFGLVILMGGLVALYVDN